GAATRCAAASRRELDLAFIAELENSPDSLRRSVLMVTTPVAEASLRLALADVGAACWAHAAPEAGWPETELVHQLRSGGRLHRTWYVQRFPGLELEPGWLYRLAAEGAEVTIAVHLLP